MGALKRTPFAIIGDSWQRSAGFVVQIKTSGNASCTIIFPRGEMKFRAVAAPVFEKDVHCQTETRDCETVLWRCRGLRPPGTLSPHGQGTGGSEAATTRTC
eukprot:1189617-Prorocentrum_minimum.AAC.2